MKASVTELPFNNLLRIHPASDAAHLLQLPSGDEYLNHLGTVHAAAQLALAEASSGEFLLRHFGSAENLVPVVRRVGGEIPQTRKWQHPIHCACNARGSRSTRRGAFIENPLGEFNYGRSLRRTRCAYAFSKVCVVYSAREKNLTALLDIAQY